MSDIGAFALRSFLLMGFAVALYYGVRQDMEEQRVYDRIWWISALFAVCLLALTGREALRHMPEFALYALVQEGPMSRAYGKADCHAFSFCGLVLTGLGFGLEGYILHMSLALISLTTVQLADHNITRQGRLFLPVPFLPYIACSFWVSVILLHLFFIR
ncbi:MAG: hypothetical protein K6E81_01875 [Lachnospiraceae bacterium]|nr:hypothetical protein [Lachnospiraceae bacterium]